MPDVQDVIRLSLVSKRQDIINFIEAMCPDEILLAVASGFSTLPLTDTRLLLIDASLFKDYDLRNLEYGEKCSEFSICILPQDIPFEVMMYVERNFRYIIPFPVNADYFRSFTLRVAGETVKIKKGYISQKLTQEKIPESFFGYFLGNSTIIKKVRGQILRAAYSREPVLILGETGTGKTTAAEVIHTLSERREKKMVSVSLSTIVETLAESAFFGHVRGSYTNAECECRGYFEEANGSSLFLDELGVASTSLQAMLLTVLETGNYKKIGESKDHHTDVRMIFATNENLEKMLGNGRFRKDLYFRICDNLICIPPLREHKEDIRRMAQNYLDPGVMITDGAIELLQEYNWPGNIRELHKCLRRAMLNSGDNVITADMIDFGEISFPQ